MRFLLAFGRPAARRTSPGKPTRRLLGQRRLHTVHVIRELADCTIDRFARSAKSRAALACLDGAGQFFHSTSLDCNELPALIERFLDLFRNIDDLRCRNAFIPASDKAVENLNEIEGIAFPAVGLQIVYLGAVFDCTKSTKGRQWTHVRMHRRVYKAAVTVEALYISRAIVPVDTKRVDRRIRIVGIGVQEFHNPTEIVRLARRFAHKVYMVYI